ncbi:MAG: hypothetical protein WCR52_08295 [Bacteroidota bacterium]
MRFPALASKKLLWILLGISGLLRLLLIGRGAVSIGDEFRYWYSAYMLLALSKGDISHALLQLFETGGRPGLVFVQMPATLIQAVLFKVFGLDPRSTDSLMVPQLVNVAVSLWTIWLVYQLGQKLGGFSQKKALLAAFLYSLLASSSLYIRHLLPYQYALAAFLYTFLMVYQGRKAFWIGVATAFAFTVYPGYWPLVGMAFLLLCLERNAFEGLKVFLQNLFRFGAGAFSVLLGFEGLSYIAGVSYFKLSAVAGNNFVYDPKLAYDGSMGLFIEYLWVTEGLVGMLLLIGTAWFLMQSAWKIIKFGAVSNLEYLCWALLGCLSLQTLLGYVTGMKVFYGRLFFQIMPFLLFASCVLVFQYSNKLSEGKKALFFVALAGLCLTKFIFFYQEYATLGYPRDLFSALGYTQKAGDSNYDIRMIDSLHDDLTRIVQVRPKVEFTQPPNGLFVKNRLAKDSNCLFLNFVSLEYTGICCYQPFMPPASYTWLVKRRHYGNFKPYWFEGDLAGRRGLVAEEALWLGVLGPVSSHPER